MADPRTGLQLPCDRNGELVYSKIFDPNFQGPVLLVGVERKKQFQNFVWIGDYKGHHMWATLESQRTGRSGDRLKDYHVLTAIDRGRTRKDIKLTQTNPSPFFMKVLRARCERPANETTLIWKIIIGFCLAKLMRKSSLLRNEDIAGYEFDPLEPAVVLRGCSTTGASNDARERPSTHQESVPRLRNVPLQKRAQSPSDTVDDRNKRHKTDRPTNAPPAALTHSPTISEITSGTREISTAQTAPNLTAIEPTEDDTVRSIMKERDQAIKQRDELVFRLRNCEKQVALLQQQNKVLGEKLQDLERQRPVEADNTGDKAGDYEKKAHLLEEKVQQHRNAWALENRKRVEAEAKLDQLRLFVKALPALCDDLKTRAQSSIDELLK